MSVLIDTAAITTALAAQIADHPQVRGFFVDVERGEYINKDPARTPWCGVYRTSVDFSPRVIGHHARSWQAEIAITLVVQAHADGGEAAEDACEDAVQRVLEAVLGDLSISGTVDMLKNIDVTYSYDETASETLDFQWAFIKLNYETRTGV